MIQSVVLLSPEPPWGQHLAGPSLAAWLAAKLPTLRVKQVSLGSGPTATEATALAVAQAAPDMVVCWVEGKSLARLTELMATLRPALAGTPFVAAGPEACDLQRATRLLKLGLGFHWAIRGEAEGPLLELLQASRGGELPEGVSALRGRGVSHAADAVAMADLEDLPSPWLSGHMQPSDSCALEIARLTLPWTSPSEGAYDSAGRRQIPLARLEAELEMLVRSRAVGQLRLGPGNADDEPFQLQQLLALLARWNTRTAVSLQLNHLPEAPLTQALVSAGVAEVRIDARGLEDSGGLSRQALSHLRVRLNSLRDQGITLTVCLEVGERHRSTLELKRIIDQLLALGVRGLKVSALRLPPGHPERVGAKRRKMLITSGAPDEVLAHPKLSFEERTELLLDSRHLTGFLPTYAATLRALSRLTRHPHSELARALSAMGCGVAIEGDGPARLDRQLEQLSHFISVTLKAQGRLDQLPVLSALLDYERWLAEPERPASLGRQVPYDVQDLSNTVPVVSPRASTRTYTYDVNTLVRGGSVVDTPARRTHVLLLRRGNGTAVSVELNELQRRAMSLVDGARPIGLLVEALTDEPGAQAYDHEVLALTFADLLGMGALLAAGTLDDPPGPELRDNVLLFPGVKGTIQGE